jgi:predicted NUDIX family NTP pyrophosphohydrolase
MAVLRSAGVLVFRRRADGPQFLLGRPGGPFWKARDAGVWSIPKGLVESGEALCVAAVREFMEETGLEVPGPFIELSPLRQKSGKTVHGFMAEADLDLKAFRSNLFELEWPKGSGRATAFPEIDRIAYLAADEALDKILPGQAGFIHEALAVLARDLASHGSGLPLSGRDASR